MIKKPMTELDKKILEIAVLNPRQFISMIGEDAWTRVKMCLLRQKGKSYEQIKNTLLSSDEKLTYDKVRYGCNQCPHLEQ